MVHSGAGERGRAMRMRGWGRAREGDKSDTAEVATRKEVTVGGIEGEVRGRRRWLGAYVMRGTRDTCSRRQIKKKGPSAAVALV